MDAASAEKIKSLHSWHQNLKKIGNRFGYYVNRSKSWLIVKTAQAADEARNIFGNSVNITTDGKRQLGAVIGSDKYKSEYIKTEKFRTTLISDKSLSEIFNDRN